MKIGLLALDSKIKNIAIEKIRLYHQNLKNDVEDYNSFNHYDMVYISKIFTFSEDYKYVINSDKIIEGGTGYDIKSKLPYEIEIMKPKINQGFLTRGCIRNCPFCFVPQKEGKIYIESKNGLLDLWDGVAKEIIIMDNNITALKDYFIFILKQAQSLNLKLDFNQGLDIRLLDEEMCIELKKTKLKEIRFAFDNIKLLNIIQDKMQLLQKYNIKAMWYVLVGFDSSFKDDIFRVNYLVKNNQRAYIMAHENCKKDKRYIPLKCWTNNPYFGKAKTDFYVFLKNSFYGKRYLKYFKTEDLK